MAGFEFDRTSECFIPKCPRFFASGPRDLQAYSAVAGDPSLRLNYGCARDDVTETTRTPPQEIQKPLPEDRIRNPEPPSRYTNPFPHDDKSAQALPQEGID